MMPKDFPMDRDNKSTTVSVRTGFGWLTMWLFTIGMTHPGFGRGVLDLIIWPYHLGAIVASICGAQ